MSNISVKKIGIEIEGEFSNDLMDLLDISEFGELKYDGSVRLIQNTTFEPREFASKPISIKNFPSFKSWLKESFNSSDYCPNVSAGLHIHLSFGRNVFPAEIISRQFYRYFKKCIVNDFPDVYDLRKNNRFCPFKLYKHIDNRRLGIDRYNRYCFINSWASYSAHKTIEIRAFPSSDIKTMIKYIDYTIKKINEFCSKPIKIRRKAKIETQGKTERYSEEIINTKKFDYCIGDLIKIN